MAARKSFAIRLLRILAAAVLLAATMLPPPCAEARATGSLTLSGFTHHVQNAADANQADLVPGADGTATGFGSIRVWDVPFRRTANSNSALVGQLKGLGAVTNRDDPSENMSHYLTFYIRYNNVSSTIIAHGTTSSRDTVKPLAMVGGTGLFELARGKVTQKTVSETTDEAGRVSTINQWKFTFFQERVGVDLQQLKTHFSTLISAP